MKKTSQNKRKEMLFYLKKICLFSVLAIVCCFPFSTVVFGAKNDIENIAITESEDGDSVVIVIESSQLLRYRASKTSNPPRIQIQIQDEVECEKLPSRPTGKKLVREIKYECRDTAVNRVPRGLLKTLSIELLKECSFSVSQKNWVLSVSVKKELSQSALLTEEQPFESGGESLPVPVGTGDYFSFDETENLLSVLSARPTIDDILQVGLSNYKPIRIAQKELALARRKLIESRRNFFPTLSLKGTETEGKIQSNPNDPSTIADYKRKEVGLEVGQPLFQSGRLYYSAKQAKMQKEIAELQVQKLTQDVTYEILKAFYAFVQARESLVLRKVLQKESEKILENTKRKKEVGLASDSEYLGVLSGANQTAYKCISQEKDLEIAKSRLLSLLNVETMPNDISATIDVQSEKIDLNLKNLISLTSANRPDLKIALLTVKLKEYGRKTSRGDYLFRVDASGFVGKSGAAYQSETLTMRDSYNLGVKGVVNFGGNSITPQVSKDKTAPDLGSTSRTETESRSVTMGILDSLSAGSNLFQAEIDEEKAKEDFYKSRKDILLEVKESFFNIQKAKLQIESAKKELEYRKKEFAIASAKDKLHQIEAPQLLQSLSGEIEAGIELKNAITFYNTSLAALEKAVGTKLTQ